MRFSVEGRDVEAKCTHRSAQKAHKKKQDEFFFFWDRETLTLRGLHLGRGQVNNQERTLLPQWLEDQQLCRSAE